MSHDCATESSNDVVRIQEQLLEMLRTAGTEVPPPRRETPVPSVAEVPPPVAPPAVSVRQLTTPPPPGTDCPKCGSDKPWGKSSWCPDCGYYPKAGFEGTALEVTEADLPPTLLDIFPEWLMPTVVGAVGIFVGSIITRFVFLEGLQRAFVAISQLLVFVGLIIAVHLRASFLAVKDGRSMMAAVNFGETWKLMLDKMPKSKLLIVLLGCSFSGIGSSFLIGLDVDLIAEHIAQEVKGKEKVTFKDIMNALTNVSKKAFGEKFESKNAALAAMGQLIQATGQITGSEGGAAGQDSLEGSIGSLAETTNMITDEGAKGKNFKDQIASSTSPSMGTTPSSTRPGSNPSSSSSGSAGNKTSAADNPQNGASESSASDNSAPSGDSIEPEKSTHDLVLIGYTANPEGEARSLLLGTVGKSGKLRYVQKLGLDGLSSDELASLTSSLKPYRIREAAASCPYGGKWVKPVVKCRIEHEGENDDSRPSDPVFRELIFP